MNPAVTEKRPKLEEGRGTHPSLVNSVCERDVSVEITNNRSPLCTYLINAEQLAVFG